jgi:hypothetical protein
MMRRRWRHSASAVVGLGLLFAFGGTAASGAEPCDEYDPAGPARGANITLSAGDFVDESRDELRSFVATGSIGRVEAVIVAATPRDAVRGIVAAPQVSRFSAEYGEELKGIAVAVALRGGSGGGRNVSVVLNLRQVCARYFRNTFLYY